jgi:hypothetical protein
MNCTHDDTLRLLPAFILTTRQVNEFLSKLQTVFAKTKHPKPEAAPASGAHEPETALAAAR